MPELCMEEMKLILRLRNSKMFQQAEVDEKKVGKKRKEKKKKTQSKADQNRRKQMQI